MKNTKNVILSILLSILWIIAFYSITLIGLIVIGFPVNFLVNLPIIQTVIGFILWWTEAYLSDLIYAVCICLAIAALKFLANKIIKNENIRTLSFRIGGLTISAFNVVFFIINLISGSPAFVNLIFVGAGLALAFINPD